jgi:hypothetical protein
MNVLSQHIAVKSENLKSLIEVALVDTLNLAFNTADFLDKEVNERNQGKLTTKNRKQLIKYIILRKKEIGEFLADMEGKESKMIREQAEQYFVEFGQEATDSLITRLSTVLILDKHDLLETIVETENTTEVDEEIGIEASESGEDKIIDSIENEPEVSTELEEFSSIEELDSTPDKIAIGKDKNEREEVEEDPIAEDTQIENEDENPIVEVYKELPSESDPEEVDAKLEKDGIDAKVETVHQKFEVSVKTLANAHEEKKINNIMEAISINHRYMFVQELFDGENENFKTTIKEVEKCGTFDGAVEYLVQGAAKENEWDMNSDEVKELLKVIFRRFR